MAHRSGPFPVVSEETHAEHGAGPVSPNSLSPLVFSPGGSAGASPIARSAISTDGAIRTDKDECGDNYIKAPDCAPVGSVPLRPHLQCSRSLIPLASYARDYLPPKDCFSPSRSDHRSRDSSAATGASAARTLLSRASALIASAAAASRESSPPGGSRTTRPTMPQRSFPQELFAPNPPLITLKTADRPRPAPERRYECQNYEGCLAIAAALNWESFTCKGCNGSVDANVLWRAHQARRSDKLAALLSEKMPSLRGRIRTHGRSARVLT